MTIEFSPAVILYDPEGNETARAEGSILPASHKSIVVYGRQSDGTVTPLEVLSDGKILDLNGIETSLNTIEGLDFSTESTLELVRLLLVSLDGKDFSTESTLELARLLLVSLDGKDFSTESTLELVRLLLVSIDSKDFATEATLAATDFATDTTLALRHNDFASLLKFEPEVGQELRADETNTRRWHGRAPEGTSTAAASWELVQFDQTPSTGITRVRYKTGAIWDDRTTEFP